MTRWIYVTGFVVATFLLTAVALSPYLHETGGSDCPELTEAMEDRPDSDSQPEHGTHAADMYANDTEAFVDCPVDDAAEMGSVG